MMLFRTSLCSPGTRCIAPAGSGPLVCVVLLSIGLLGCDRTPTQNAAAGGNDGTAPTHPTPSTQGSGGRGLAGLINAVDANEDANTASASALPQPDNPSRLLFMGMEAPTSPLWQWQPPRSSAWVAQWIVPGPEGSESAELVLWTSESAAGDLAREHIPTWEKHFRSGIIPTKAKVAHRTIGGMDVHLVELAGEYTGMGGGWHRPDFRQMTAIAAGPDGTVVFRLLGPNDTVEAHRRAFNRMIDGLRTTR